MLNSENSNKVGRSGQSHQSKNNRRKNKKRKENEINIASLNVRTLKSEENLVELEYAVENSKIDILGLSEVRRKGENIIETKEGNLLCHIGNNFGQKGVGFWITKKYKIALKEFRGINDRIALLIMVLNKITISIIQIYAPTAMSEEKDCKNFYKELQNTYEEIKNQKNNHIFIMGDFNCQIGKRNEEEKENLGPYFYGVRNDRGWELIRFCQENNLKIINTLFKKRDAKKWTWEAPNHEYRRQLDYMLTPIKTKNIKNFEALQNFSFNSDHRAIRCTLAMTTRQFYSKPKSFTTFDAPTNENQSDYENKLSENLKKLDMNVEVDLISKNIIEAMKNANKKIQKTIEKERPQKIPIEIQALIKKRENLKRKRQKSTKTKVELNMICKKIKKDLRNFNMEKNERLITEILDSTKSIKQMKKNRTLGKNYTTYLTDKNGNKIYDRKKINEHATSFYSDLYKDENHLIPKEKNQEWKLEAEPEIIPREVEWVISNLKNNKAPGSDKISNEFFKLGGKLLVDTLTKLFNKILIDKKIPENWKQSDIILIFKKGERDKITNYRPISLSLTIAKIFSKILECRIKPFIQQPREQAGFRSAFSTSDHLHVLNQLIEKCEEYGVELHLAFVDFTKAFDLLNHKFLLLALRNQGTPEIFVEIIEQMYTELKSRITTDVMGTLFKIQRGVRQGDPLSPILFNSALEEVFKNLNWEKKGININGEYLNNLRFADDVTLVAGSQTEIETMLRELDKMGKGAGLAMNISKTKLLNNKNVNYEININGEKIETAESVIYLGKKISCNYLENEEIDRRITLSWNKFWALKFILKGPFSLKSKSEVFNTCVLPSLTYGSETWTLSKKIEHKIRITQNSMERSILNVKKKDHIKISTIKSRLKYNKNAVKLIRKKKWNWGGHVARLPDNRWTQKITFWYLTGKRRQGRQKARWRDDFGKLLQHSNYQRIAHDRMEWTRLGEAFALM